MQPRFRSRSFKRIKKTTPSGKRVIHFRRKKVGIAHCASCKVKLAGVASYRANKMKKLSKTQKRPERPYAGVLCSKCMRLKIKEVVNNVVN